jgi:hypothetical protein
MRAIRLTQTGAGSTKPIPMDQYISPFNVGLGVDVSGTVNYTVQHTFDDVFAAGYNPATGTWLNHPTLAAQSADADGNYAFPVSAIRLTVNSGGGSAVLNVLQAGISGT